MPAITLRWYLIHITIIIINMAFVIGYYDYIPETIPMKYDFQGNITRTADKSWSSILFIHFIQLFILVCIIFTAHHAAKSDINAGSNAPQDPRFMKQFRAIWSFYFFILALILIGLFTMVQMAMILVWSGLTMIVIAISFIVITILLTAYAVIKTNQLKKQFPALEEAHSSSIKAWKGGIFYFDPANPAVFVRKRFGIGLTLNFANPISWLILAIIVAFVVVTIWIGD